MKVKTRFAPSPTGLLHIGGARTALYSWLYAKNQGGEFVLRIEDTDTERSTQAAIDAIMEGMTWLGFDWDEGPYYQTKRFDRYNQLIDQLLAEGKAYKCYCSKDRLEALREGQMADLKNILEMSAAMQSLAHNTRDNDEAINAFIEKRTPVFTGE